MQTHTPGGTKVHNKLTKQRNNCAFFYLRNVSDNYPSEILIKYRGGERDLRTHFQSDQNLRSWFRTAYLEGSELSGVLYDKKLKETKFVLVIKSGRRYIEIPLYFIEGEPELIIYRFYGFHILCDPEKQLLRGL